MKNNVPSVVGENAVSQWYQNYYSKSGSSRNDLRTNPGVLFQILAMERAVVLALRDAVFPLVRPKILDIGCGSGANTYQLLRAGADINSLTGIDIYKERLSQAKVLYPSAHWVHGDAGNMSFQNGEFDLVTEFTMFATLPDDELCGRIAAEMLRVCKPGGYLLLIDWRTPKIGDSNYLALTRARLGKLFKIGSEVVLVGVYPGALIPPLGRFLSHHMPSMYFMIASLFPFMVGQVGYLLKKRGGQKTQAGEDI